jgi:hypothetical protein
MSPFDFLSDEERETRERERVQMASSGLEETQKKRNHSHTVEK